MEKEPYCQPSVIVACLLTIIPLLSQRPSASERRALNSAGYRRPPDCLHPASRPRRINDSDVQYLNMANGPRAPYLLPQHLLYFFPLPQGHGTLRPSPRTSSIENPEVRFRRYLQRSDVLLRHERDSRSNEKDAAWSGQHPTFIFHIWGVSPRIGTLGPSQPPPVQRPCTCPWN